MENGQQSRHPHISNVKCDTLILYTDCDSLPSLVRGTCMWRCQQVQRFVNNHITPSIHNKALFCRCPQCSSAVYKISFHSFNLEGQFTYLPRPSLLGIKGTQNVGTFLTKNVEERYFKTWSWCYNWWSDVTSKKCSPSVWWEEIQSQPRRGVWSPRAVSRILITWCQLLSSSIVRHSVTSTLLPARGTELLSVRQTSHYWLWTVSHYRDTQPTDQRLSSREYNVTRNRNRQEKC